MGLSLFLKSLKFYWKSIKWRYDESNFLNLTDVPFLYLKKGKKFVGQKFLSGKNSAGKRFRQLAKKFVTFSRWNLSPDNLMHKCILEISKSYPNILLFYIRKKPLISQNLSENEALITKPLSFGIGRTKYGR